MPEIQDLDIVDANNTARFPEGMLGSAINNAARALEGILARWYEDTDGSITSTGSSNAYAVTSKRTIAALTNNTVMAFTANFSNTGAATLAFNGLTAKAIRRPNGDALVANDIISGQQVIVVYKSSPDYWQLLSPTGALGANHIPARAYSEYATNASITTVIPKDDTIPQNTEGTEIVTASITLKRSDSRVRVRFAGFGECVPAAGDDMRTWIAALFKDSTADALQVVIAGVETNNVGVDPTSPAVLEFEHAPGSVGPFTYKVRVGPTESATLRLNGTISARLLGGAAKATLVVEEVFV